MSIVWIVIGLIMAAVPFWFFSVPMDPWSGVNAGALGAGLFTVIFLVAILRHPVFSRNVRILTCIMFIIIAGSISISWKAGYDQSHYQRQRLGEIRTVIGEGILKSYSTQAALKTLRAYYLQKPARKTPIGTLFLQVNKEWIKNGLLFDEDPRYHITYLTDQTPSGITLVSVDSVARGRDDKFKNADGQTGRLQMRVTLTEKGVRHERDN